jgi:hypothetical protein
MNIELMIEALKVGGLPLLGFLAIVFGIRRGGSEKESDQSRIDGLRKQADTHEIKHTKADLLHDDHERRIGRLERDKE